MKKYMFYTTDGYTQDEELNETENCQLLGFAKGKNAYDAYDNFLAENEYIMEHSYKNIMGCEIVGEPICI